MESTQRILFPHIGGSWIQSQYFQRAKHYTHEKKLLAESLVEDLLPSILKTIEKEYPQLKELNIYLDSGTTISPVFSNLMRKGINIKKTVNWRIYTNNLAGIEEVQKLSTVRSMKLNERDFNVLPGSPLGTYRAITGEATQEFLRLLMPPNRNDRERRVNMCVITSNWFIAGDSLKELSICARGAGHYVFKKYLIQECDFLVVLSPLGKLLQIDHENELEEIVPAGYHQDSPGKIYQAYPFDTKKRNRTYLLTSFRTERTASPLRKLSETLDRIRDKNQTLNYVVSKYCPRIDPYSPENDSDLAWLTDVPHDYIRQHFTEVYNYY